MILVHIEKVQGGYIVAYHEEKPKAAELQQVMKTGEFPGNLMAMIGASVRPNDPQRRICTSFSDVVEFLKELFGEP